MKMVLISLIPLMLVAGCEERTEKESGSVEHKMDKPMIRSIRFLGTDDRFGIEMNGSSAFVHRGAEKSSGIEIPYADGLALLEEFYAIRGIEKYRGTKSMGRQSAIHHLIHVYDELPERFSEDWVDYVIPKDEVALDAELSAWFGKMDALKRQTGR